jgi:hypothetical protein
MGERSGAVPLLAEVFRTYGFEGASLARISEGTGLGKGSIYNFSRAGKTRWPKPCSTRSTAGSAARCSRRCAAADVKQGVADMFKAVGRYFLSGRKVCLVGVFALGHERDRFAAQGASYFAEWVQALAAALQRGGRDQGRRWRWPRMWSAASRARWCWRVHRTNRSCSCAHGTDGAAPQRAVN